MVRNRAIIAALIKLMLDQKADVLSIDSFIRTHEVNENDNSAMLEVVECFEEIALGGKCAVHLWHHTRKASSGEQITVASARGAGAIADAFRSYRMLETMTEKEHEQLLGIAPDMLAPGFYFRGFNGKRNFAPPAEQSDWFKLENIEICSTGTRSAWQRRGPIRHRWRTSRPDVAARILRISIAGCRMAGGTPTTTAPATRQAWPIVQKHCPTKTEANAAARSRNGSSWARYMRTRTTTQSTGKTNSGCLPVKRQRSFRLRQRRTTMRRSLGQSRV